MRCQNCSYVYDGRKMYRCPKCKTAPDLPAAPDPIEPGPPAAEPDLFAPKPVEDLPAPKVKRPHLSVTQMRMYQRCPRQYEYRYIHGLRERPAGALIQGKVFHTTIEDNLTQKIQTETDLPLDEMTDRFATHFKEASEAEDIDWKDETPDEAKDTGVTLVTAHHKELAPKLHPAIVEKEFSVPLGDTHDLNGRIDLIEKDGQIVDHKTAAKSPSQDDADTDMQLTAYALVQQLEGAPAPALRLDVVTKAKTPKAIRLTTVRTENDLLWFVTMFEQIAAAIKTGIFPPNPNGWHCSKTACGYWERCRSRV